MKTWQKWALALAIPGGVLLGATLVLRKWLRDWEQGHK
jgi:hypothetical protein